jgi:hypothetical protein
MDYFEFFQATYKSEADRRAQLSSLLPIPLGIFTVVGGGLYAMAQGLSLPLDGWEIACAAFLVGALALGIAAAYNLTRFQFGHKYRYLAFSDEIENYRKLSTDYYKGRGQPAAAADEDVRERIRSDFIDVSSFNARVNDKKTRFLYITNSFLAACALFALAASIPFSIGRMSSERTQRPISFTISSSFCCPVQQGACHARRRGQEAAAGTQAHRRRQAGMAASKGDSRE